MSHVQPVPASPKKKRALEGVKEFSAKVDSILEQRKNPRREVTHFETPDKRKMRQLNDRLLIEQQAREETQKQLKDKNRSKEAVERLFRLQGERDRKIESLRRAIEQEELAQANNRQPRLTKNYVSKSPRPRASLYEASRRDESFDELASKRRNTAHFLREKEENERECTFKPESYSSYRPDEGSLEERESSREEHRNKLAQKALAQFLKDHPFRPNKQRGDLNRSAEESNRKKVAERLYNDAKERESSKQKQQAEERAKMFRPEINENSKKIAETLPDRKEKLYKAKYDTKENVDYFVVEDTPKKVSEPRSDRKKQTARTQDTLGKLGSSDERDFEDSPASTSRPPLDTYDPANEYTIKVPDNDFVSFYDETDLPGPKQSVMPSLKKSAAQAPQSQERKKPVVQKNTFFQSQVESVESMEAWSPEKVPIEKKKTNQFVSELVTEPEKPKGPESKKESYIINHFIKRDESKPSAGFFLLKLEDGDPKDEDEEVTGLRTPNRNNVESSELLETKKENMSFQKDEEDLGTDSFEEFKQQQLQPEAAEPSFKKSQIRALFDELYV